ncbi:MAG: RagB/SusD family nutrient uptake outer membrane protein [Parabacteroides sp.]|nr:RagB/SusD family nutrient uptake outer membrane protein [Parabacteroides sp.]
MKYKYLTLLSVLVGLAANSCNDSFLERYPLDTPTEASVFISNENFKNYAWSLYETLPSLYSKDNDGATDVHTDNISVNWERNTGESSWIRGNVAVPTTSNDQPWSYYTLIRKANLMLDNIDAPQSELSNAEKKHWRSVGLFFRSFRYFTMLSAYGGVPWIEHVLDSSSPEAKAPRDSRDLVAGNILRDLKYAEENIGESDGNNTISVDVVQALLSRFTLFEGTWRKYHGLEDAGKYLEECARVSKELIDKHPALHPKYDDLFNSIDLKGVEGVLLYKEYNFALSITHRTGVGVMTNSRKAIFDVTKDMVDCYLCTDGQTRWSSPLYQGETDLYKEFASRDRRLWFCVAVPFIIDKGPGGWDIGWDYLPDDPDFYGIDSLKARSYMDSIAAFNLTTGQKTLPVLQGTAPVLSVPHYSFMRRQQPWARTQFGYHNWKFYNTLYNQGGVTRDAEETDIPIFRIEETMLNYAEAMFELGKERFNQSVADQTINRLRERAGVAPMVVANITAGFDPHRDTGGEAGYPGDYEVDPVLWEICRERRVEFLMEDFRFEDLRRWKKMNYAMRLKRGQWVDKADLRKQDKTGPAFWQGTFSEAECTIDRPGDQGYLTFHAAQTHTFPDYYYLYPIPLDQLVLNPELEQNPGWE